MLKRFFCNEFNILILIVLNAITITLLYFPTFQGNDWLETADRCFTILFVIEAITKIVVFRPSGYFGSSWNWFDFVLVVLSLPSLLVGLIPLPDTSFWLLFRLLRLARLIRFFRFVPHVDQLLAGLGRALRASLLVMAVLAFMNFMLAMVTCHFFRDIAPELFGNPFLSAYSMFQIFTVEGWQEIPREIQNSIKANGLSTHWLSGDGIVNLSRIYFATIMLFGGIFGLSLANAIFVDEMTIDNNDELEAKMDVLAKRIEEIHELLDRRMRDEG